jgi:hypothetical protein
MDAIKRVASSGTTHKPADTTTSVKPTTSMIPNIFSFFILSLFHCCFQRTTSRSA